MSLDPTPVAAPQLHTPESSGGLRAAIAAVRRPLFVRRVERALFAVAFVSLGWCAYALLESAGYEYVQERRLNRLTATASVRNRHSLGPRGALATRAETRAHGLVGKLELRRLGLSAIVAEGTGSRTLRHAVGHLAGSPFPGEPGNVVLAAHRDRHFRPLRKVRKGDVVRLSTPDGTFFYRVEFAKVVDPESTALVQDVTGPVLTLVTCYPFYYVGDAPQRFVVRARLVQKPRVDL